MSRYLSLVLQSGVRPSSRGLSSGRQMIVMMMVMSRSKALSDNLVRQWAHQTGYIHPTLVYWWASVAVAGLSLNQHWVDVSCLVWRRHNHCQRRASKLSRSCQRRAIPSKSTPQTNTQCWGVVGTPLWPDKTKLGQRVVLAERSCVSLSRCSIQL